MIKKITLELIGQGKYDQVRFFLKNVLNEIEQDNDKSSSEKFEESNYVLDLFFYSLIDCGLKNIDKKNQEDLDYEREQFSAKMNNNSYLVLAYNNKNISNSSFSFALSNLFLFEDRRSKPYIESKEIGKDAILGVGKLKGEDAFRLFQDESKESHLEKRIFTIREPMFNSDLENNILQKSKEDAELDEFRRSGALSFTSTKNSSKNRSIDTDSISVKRGGRGI